MLSTMKRSDPKFPNITNTSVIFHIALDWLMASMLSRKHHRIQVLGFSTQKDSIVLFAVVDAQYNFVIDDVSAYGRQSNQFGCFVLNQPCATLRLVSSFAGVGPWACTNYIKWYRFIFASKRSTCWRVVSVSSTAVVSNRGSIVGRPPVVQRQFLGIHELCMYTVKAKQENTKISSVVVYFAKGNEWAQL